MSFYNDHPELLPGEIFLTNATEDDFDDIDYQSKRQGMVAYDAVWHPIKSLIPVFVREEEYNEVQQRLARTQD